MLIARLVLGLRTFPAVDVGGRWSAPICRGLKFFIGDVSVEVEPIYI